MARIRERSLPGRPALRAADPSGKVPSREPASPTAPMSGAKAYYERYWREGFWTDNPYERWKLDHVTRIVSSAPRGARVLDVGCGDGRVAAGLAAAGARCTGVDVSEQAVAQARARGVEALAADLDAGPLPVAPGSFDLALCLDVFEHLFEPAHLLAQIRAALAPRGRLLVAVPNGLNLFNRLAFLSGRHVDVMDKAHLSREPFSEHLRFFSREVFEGFLVDGGLPPVERLFFFPDTLTDARFRAGAWLARAVTGLRLQDRAPSLFALEFLFVCERRDVPHAT